MYYVTPANAPDGLEALLPLEVPADLSEMPSLDPGDRVVCTYNCYGRPRIVVCQTVEDIQRVLRAGAEGRYTDLKWFHNLKLLTHDLDDPSIECVAVMRGETVRRGDRVKHYGARWTGEAIATVIGFYNERAEGKPWMKVLVIGDDPEVLYVENGFKKGWDWDRTQRAPDILM